jgi:hypothetical protein
MRVRRTMLLAALALVGLASPSVQAGGRVAIGVGIGVPGPYYYRPYGYYYRPYYYGPYPAVYVEPRPVYVVPSGQPVYVQPGVYQAAPGYAPPQYAPAPQYAPMPQPVPQGPPALQPPPAPTPGQSY